MVYGLPGAAAVDHRRRTAAGPVAVAFLATALVAGLRQNCWHSTSGRSTAGRASGASM